jgi:hypothetical protein
MENSKPVKTNKGGGTRNAIAVLNSVALKDPNSATVAGSGINKVDSFELKAESESEAGMSFESLLRDSSSPSSEGSTNSVKRMVSQIDALEQDHKREVDSRKLALNHKSEERQPPQAGMSSKSLRLDSSSPSSEGSTNSVKKMASQINALERERQREVDHRKLALKRIKANKELQNLKDGEPRMQDPKTDILSASFVYEGEESQSPQAGSLRRSTRITEIEGRIEALYKRIREAVTSGTKLEMKKLNYINELKLKVEGEKESPGGFLVRSSFGLLDPETHDSRFTSIENPSVAKRLLQENLENNYNSYSPNSLGDIKNNKSPSEQMRYEEQHPKKFSPDIWSAFQASRSLEEFSKVIGGARGLLSPKQGSYVLETTENNSIINVRREEKTDDSLQKLEQAIRVFDKEIEKNKLEKLKLWAEIKELNEEKKAARSENREINSEIKERQENLVIDRRKESEDPSEGPAPKVPPRKLLSKNNKGSSR